jgi:hypothetical protein
MASFLSGAFAAAFFSPSESLAESLAALCSRIHASLVVSRVDARRVEDEWEEISASTSLIASLSRKNIIKAMVKCGHEDIVTTLMKREGVQLAASAVSNGPRECRRGEDNAATYLLSAAMEGMVGEGALMGATRWTKNRFMLDNWLSDAEVLGCLMSPEEKRLVRSKIENFGWGEDGAARRDSALLAFDSHPASQFDDESLFLGS